MTRYICVTSGKGGVGKTTTAVNLAGSMSKQGKDAVLVDANISTPHVHIHLGQEGDISRHLHHAVNEEVHISRIIYKHVSGVRVVPSKTELEHFRKPDYEGLKYALMDMDGHAEIVILDSAPGFGREAVVPMEVADEILVVTTADISSIDDARKTIEVAEELGKHILGIVVNMHRDDSYEEKIDHIENILGHPVISIIPHDDNVRSSWKKKHPVVHIHPNSRASKGFEELTSALIGPRYTENLKHKNL